MPGPNLPQDGSYDETKLLQRLADGDRRAFTELYSFHYSSIFSFLLFVTKSREQSEEILQDIFLKVWVKRSTLTGIKSFANYLFIMAKNRLFDLRKTEDNRQAILQQISYSQGSENPVFDELLLKEYERLAIEAFNRLPELRKQIFFMNAFEDLTAQAISEKLALPLSTVKKHLYKAYHFIKDFLKQHADLALLLITLKLF